MSAGRRVPHDLEAEKAVLGAALLEGAEPWAIASDIVATDDFHDSRHREIVAHGIEPLARANKPIDLVLVRQQLDAAGRLERAGGDEYLMSLTETVPTADSLEEQAQRVRDLSLLRRARAGALEFIQKVEQGVTDPALHLDAFERLPAICDQRGAGVEVVAVRTAIDTNYAQLLQRHRSPHRLRGHATGYPRLDRGLSGLGAGDLVIGAGRPGTGKTSFALCIARNIAAVGQHVLFVSLEMTADGLAERLLASNANVDLRRLRIADIRNHEWATLTQTSSEIAELPLHLIQDRDMNVLDLRRAARRLKRRTGSLGLVVVDYLQLVRPAKHEQNREREIAEISGALKSMAGELECPVLALSQLNRSVETRTNKRPMLADLRESGAIEQDADVVLFLYRDEVYDPKSADKGIAEVIIAKQRSGPTGTVKLRWSAEYTRFDNLETHESAHGNWADAGGSA